MWPCDLVLEVFLFTKINAPMFWLLIDGAIKVGITLGSPQLCLYLPKHDSKIKQSSIVPRNPFTRGRPGHAGPSHSTPQGCPDREPSARASHSCTRRLRILMTLEKIKTCGQVH
jgi:hypothetical protein